MSLSTVTTRASFKLASPVKKYLGTQIANGPRTVTLLVIILKYFISENHTPDDYATEVLAAGGFSCPCSRAGGVLKQLRTESD